MSAINVKGKCVIPETAYVHPNVQIRCETFEVGPHTYIGEGTKITCRHFKAGKYLYMPTNVEVGRGGCTGPESEVIIGDHVGIFENTMINPSSKVTIGDNVGIGCDVQIWTHGAWLDVMRGFPSSFGPVEIGNDVWLPARSIVLPNVTIGDCCVVTINSVVNRSLPSGCLAGGNPAKVIKENVYPKDVSLSERSEILMGLIDEWTLLMGAKGYEAVVNSRVESPGVVSLEVCGGDTHLRSIDATIDVSTDSYTVASSMWPSPQPHHLLTYIDDLVDFLRRRGCKIYSHGRRFKSLPPKYM
jgi:acetyltransferase-like isoleucine patch superfamily enzyme